MRFPALEGDSLRGEHLAFPAAFLQRTIVLVAFDVAQRDELATWVDFVDRHVRSGRCDGRVFAVIARSMKLLEGMIVATMRKAAPSDEARAATVALFTDVDAFCAQLDIADRTSIVVFVVEAGGTIMVRRSGAFDAASARDVAAYLAEPA